MLQLKDLTQLTASWTKYSAVQVLNSISSEDELKKYLSKKVGMDEPILRKFIGIKKLSDPIPQYWLDLQKYPDQKRLFGLLAAIFTHYQNIEDFAESHSTGDMKGVLKMQNGKNYTNLRSALVESGAAANSYRRKEEVPYDLTPLYERGAVGILFKQLLTERLTRIGYTKAELEKYFYTICYGHRFHKAISLTEKDFQKWLEGTSLVESPLKYNLKQLKNYEKIQAFKVNQWLHEWDNIDFNNDDLRSKPDPHFLMFKMDARLLKRLSDVHRRKAEKSRSDDPNTQRTHSVSRSEEIHKYIHGGFPWSTISKNQQEDPEYKELKMPGILPTAIIANILGPGSERGNYSIKESDLIKVPKTDSDFLELELPSSAFQEEWDPDLKPIEIIDGQHRLWAFDENEKIEGNYEVPVVAYYDLDRAWQAYLFYTINIKPVKINTSLGYDLYPLLRTQKWLESSKEGLIFYRENRAQELVEALWSYKESPWKNRVKMLGEGDGNISQAAFIRALTNSFFKKSVEQTSWGMGGLFSDIIKRGKKIQVLTWNRSQQAGFLILLWDLIAHSVDKDRCKEEWAIRIRKEEKKEEILESLDPAFTSKNSFLSRDQGVRGISMFANDFFFSLANSENWNLNEIEWEDDLDDRTIESASIDKAIAEFKSHAIYPIMRAFATEISKMDWRTPSADFEDNPVQKDKQMKYKGGSGYREVWNSLALLFKKSSHDVIKEQAEELEHFIR